MKIDRRFDREFKRLTPDIPGQLENVIFGQLLDAVDAAFDRKHYSEIIDILKEAINKIEELQ